MIANPQNIAPLEQATSGIGLHVALYLRMSDREQKLSLAQQRKECRAYADSRGWIIDTEYVDSGKSGSKELHKRVQFHAMIADAEKNGRTWQAILVWDSSRFGRLDTLKGAPHKDRLRDAGVWLESTKGERIDWSTSIGRVMDALQSEQHHEFSLKLSRDVIRGRKLITEMGFLATPVPFGYDRRYVEGDKVQMVVPRKQQFSKPRNWRLVPQINEAEAEVVRWIFNQWKTRDMSFGMTVRELYRRGTPSPAGVPSWTIAQVKDLLTDPIYTGAARVGKGCKSKEVHGRIGERQKPNAHDAIVDTQTFAIVGDKVKKREGAEWRPKSNSGALSGILKCGKCGHTLARRRQGRYNYYVCESASKRPHHGCSQWRVNEDEMLPIITRDLVEAVDFELLNEYATRRETKKDTKQIETLREQVGAMRGQIDRAAKRMLLVDEANFADAQAALTELRQTYQQQANSLKLLESDADGEERKSWSKWWKRERGEAITYLKLYGEKREQALKAWGVDLSKGPVKDVRAVIPYRPDAMRSLLHRLNTEVTLFWSRYGTRNWRLTTGTLRATFSPDAVALNVSPEHSGNPAHRSARSSAPPAPSR